MNESYFRRSLKLHMPRSIFVHIESKIGLGLPDTQFFNSQSGGWIELKYYKTRPKKSISRLRREQVIWLREYSKAGGRCFVLVRSGKYEILAWSGKYALELRTGRDIFSLPSYQCFDLRHGGWYKLDDYLTYFDEESHELHNRFIDRRP